MSDATAPVSAAPDPLQAGRAAVARHAWPEAFEQLSRAESQAPLSGADLESLALAAFFVARADIELEIRERAFKAYEAEGDRVRAAFVAIDVARRYGYDGKFSIASAWGRRAERIIGPEGDTYAHGYLALGRSEQAAVNGDTETALALAERAVEIGLRVDDADLRAYAQTNLGVLKIASGATFDGFALMEEASIAAVNGELTPFTSGVTTCRMIGACRDMTDYGRAIEWIEATERYCARQSLSGFPGICRVHRAEVTALGGGWERAEQELEQATIELGAYRATPPQADGYYAIGDIRRLKGEFERAEEALREANARGRSLHPALALLRLAQGKTKAAAAAINAAVDEAVSDQWARARLLPAQIEIAVAAGDIARARRAVEDLTEIISGYPSPAMEAGRRLALARVLLAEGDAAAAVRELRTAIKGWRDVGSPYEVARGRALLSRALRALDDVDGADLELEAALDSFRRLGARPDIAAAEREQRDARARGGAAQSARKTFMFTDIVGSTQLAEVMGDQAWETVLGRHNDILVNEIKHAGGEVVTTTGDGFFVVFDGAHEAVDCAIAIQRELRDHRAEKGFLPAVRVGLHTAEANRRGNDYSGMGVHVAARVAALAGGGEILASADTLAEAGDVPASALRTESVKGVTAPVELAAIVWS